MSEWPKKTGSGLPPSRSHGELATLSELRRQLVGNAVLDVAETFETSVPSDALLLRLADLLAQAAIKGDRQTLVFTRELLEELVERLLDDEAEEATLVEADSVVALGQLIGFAQAAWSLSVCLELEEGR